MDLYPKQQPIFDAGSSGAAPRRAVSVGAASVHSGDKRRLLEKRRSRLDALRELELDGFSSLAEASGWCARVFWLVFLVAVLAVLAFELYKTVDGYVNQPVITTFTVVKNDSMRLPALQASGDLTAASFHHPATLAPQVCFGNVFNESRIRASPQMRRAALAFQQMLFNQSSSIKHNKRRRPRAASADGDSDSQCELVDAPLLPLARRGRQLDDVAPWRDAGDHTCHRGLSWVLSPSPQQKVDRRQLISDRTQTVKLIFQIPVFVEDLNRISAKLSNL